MPAVCLVHMPEDRTFVENWLLPPLPALGFDRVLSVQPGEDSASTFERSAVVLVVVTAATPDSVWFVREADAALKSRTPILPVYRTLPEPDARSWIIRELARVAGIDARDMTPPDLWRGLARLIPRPDSGLDGDPDNAGVPIPWSVEAFSDLLGESAEHNDFEFGEALVDAFTAHPWRPSPYPAAHTRADLGVLRAKRQFLLMRRYAAAAVGSGTTDFRVRRQYAQALIELKDFDEAEKVLESLILDATVAGDDERYEARGLLGRAYKQRYVDADNRREGMWLVRAIDTYSSAFDEYKGNVWHGINAASCLLRAARDGVPAPALDAAGIARSVLGVLDARQEKAQDGRLDVWDCATRVEAHIDLDDVDAASACLDDYLAHPDMEPFEVSSTYRQFDEVLQLRESERGRPLLDRLAAAAERLRTGGLTRPRGTTVKQLLVRVADPAWAPIDLPDLVIHARLGTVVSISGTTATVEALLKDPVVIGIEESRPSGRLDCERSLPFVRVKETYDGQAGPFIERGAGALIAVIDDGIDVLHEAFLSADGWSRIVGIWDQTDASGPTRPELGIGSGTFHDRDDIAGYLHDKHVPDALRRSGGHGTHVASIAAGRLCGAFAGGVAPDASLLVVVSSAEEATGYSNAHIEALEFIDRMATSLGLPVVVNVSQGMNAGAHDGKSLLEAGFDAFSKSGREPGRVVVKSAGNERGKRGHAKLTIPPGGFDELSWQCPPGRRNVYLELWWNSINHYRFRLDSPNGDRSDWVSIRNPHEHGSFRGQGHYELTLTRNHADNGDTLLTIQFTVGFLAGDACQWTLAIEAVDVCRAGDIHAWIERDGLGLQTEFVNHDTEEMTLSIPGTARDVITVGAVDAQRPVRLGGFSSFGPTRDGRQKPDLCAPGVEIKAALAGSRDGVKALCGTSMAAPHVTGAVALLLSKAARTGQPVPTATQIRAMLTQNTMFRNAYWDRGQGFGVLDVTALLEAE